MRGDNLAKTWPTSGLVYVTITSHFEKIRYTGGTWLPMA